MKTNSYSVMNKTTFLNVKFELWDQVLGIIATNNHKFQGPLQVLNFYELKFESRRKTFYFLTQNRVVERIFNQIYHQWSTSLTLSTNCQRTITCSIRWNCPLLSFFFPSPRGCGDGSNVCPSSLANRSSRLERSSNHDRGTCDRWLERCHQIVCEQMTRSCPYLEYRWKLFSWSGKSSSRGYSNSLSNMMVYPDCERELRDNFLCVS